MRTVFFGTPDPARNVLQYLINHGCEIVGVVTQPDRPRGRGQPVGASAVAQLAEASKLPVIKPDSVRSENFIAWMKVLSPEIAVVVAYGKMLPAEVLQIPEYGCINVHASLLPKYRGAAPVQWAILNGEKETGITIMQLDAGLDTGPILSQQKIPIDEADTTSTLLNKLFAAANPLLLSVLKSIQNSTLEPEIQNSAQASFAPALRKEEGILDFKNTASALRDRIRAFDPWPGAFTYCKGKLLKILRVDPVFCQIKKGVAPGQVVAIIKGRGFVLAAADLGLLVEEVQPESGRRMSAYDFVLGRKIKVGDVFPS